MHGICLELANKTARGENGISARILHVWGARDLGAYYAYCVCPKKALFLKILLKSLYNRNENAINQMCSLNSNIWYWPCICELKNKYQFPFGLIFSEIFVLNLFLIPHNISLNLCKNSELQFSKYISTIYNSKFVTQIAKSIAFSLWLYFNAREKYKKNKFLFFFFECLLLPAFTRQTFCCIYVQIK